MPSRSLPTIDEHDQQAVAKPQRRKVGMLSTKTADACLDWVIFPALLFIQFGATMYCQMRQGILILDWKVVHATVLLFCVVAGVYRQVLRRHPWESLVMLLLPEVFTNILLAMVMFGSLITAYESLVVLTFTLLAVGSLAAAHTSLLKRDVAPTDYQRLREEDDEDTEDEWVC
jgi:hypothetical protein